MVVRAIGQLLIGLVLYLILGSAMTTVTVMGVGLTRRLFTPDHRLCGSPARDGRAAVPGYL